MRAIAMGLMTLLLTTGFVSVSSLGTATESHTPIVINGDGGFAGCGCVRSGSGTAADPFIISDWRIENPYGPSITIKDLRNKHVRVEDNTLVGRQAIVVEDVQSSIAITGNILRPFYSSGYALVDVELTADVSILSNTVKSTSSHPHSGPGIRVQTSVATIGTNAIERFRTGVLANQATVDIDNNILSENHDAIKLTDSVNANIRGNTIHLNDGWGIDVDRGSVVDVIGNTVTEGYGGVVVTSSTLSMEQNVVVNQKAEAVRFTDSVVTMDSNTVRDNWAGAVGAQSSNVRITNNLMENNRNVAIRLSGAEGAIVANTLNGNGLPEDGGGIALEDSIIQLKDNTLEHNGYGISIPYDSRQSIPLMSGNFVNGINVDGTVNAGERILYYRNVVDTVQGRLLDNNHVNGYFGVLIKEGNLVVYDSEDLLITDNTIKYGLRGIYIVNSQRIEVRNNTFLDNHIAVEAKHSRVFIKENECDLTIDPPGTVCFIVRGGHGQVRFNLVAHVDLGILFTTYNRAAATGAIEANTVTGTKVGVQVEGATSPLDVDVHLNTLVENRIGLRLLATHAEMEANTIIENDVGVQLRSGSDVSFFLDVVADNRVGINDDRCTAMSDVHCSEVTLRNVTVRGNLDVGARLGPALVEGSVFIGNGAHGEHNGGGQGLLLVQGGVVAHSEASLNVGAGIEGYGHVTLWNATADENHGDGFVIVGEADIEMSTSINNHGNGALLFGYAEVGEDSNFTANGEAGLDLRGHLFYVSECKVHGNEVGVILGEAMVDVNVDVDIQAVIELIVDLAPEPEPPQEEDQDPLFMDHCRITANTRHALEVSVNGYADARQNYWGADGPVFDVGLGGHNSIQGSAIVSPYYKDAEMTELAVVPGASPVTPAPGA